MPFVGCDRPEAFWKVYSMDSGCPEGSGLRVWSTVNADGTGTTVCLGREFRVGQCFPVNKSSTGALVWHLSSQLVCEEPVPEDFQYVMKITGVVNDGNSECPRDSRGNRNSFVVAYNDMRICAFIVS